MPAASETKAGTAVVAGVGVLATRRGLAAGSVRSWPAPPRTLAGAEPATGAALASCVRATTGSGVAPAAPLRGASCVGTGVLCAGVPALGVLGADGSGCAHVHVQSHSQAPPVACAMIGPSPAIGGGTAALQSSSQVHDHDHGFDGGWSPTSTPPIVTGAATFCRRLLDGGAGRGGRLSGRRGGDLARSGDRACDVRRHRLCLCDVDLRDGAVVAGTEDADRDVDVRRGGLGRLRHRRGLLPGRGRRRARGGRARSSVCTTFVASAPAVTTFACVTGPWSPGLRMLMGMWTFAGACWLACDTAAATCSDTACDVPTGAPDAVAPESCADAVAAGPRREEHDAERDHQTRQPGVACGPGHRANSYPAAQGMSHTRGFPIHASQRSTMRREGQPLWHEQFEPPGWERTRGTAGREVRRRRRSRCARTWRPVTPPRATTSSSTTCRS